MSKVPLSPRLTRGRKRTGLINQLFIGSVLMRSRVKRGNRTVFHTPLRFHDHLDPVALSDQLLGKCLNLGGCDALQCFDILRFAVESAEIVIV